MMISWRNIWHVVVGFFAFMLVYGLIQELRFFIMPTIGELIYGAREYNQTMPWANGSTMWLVEDWAAYAFAALLTGFALFLFMPTWSRKEVLVLAVLVSLLSEVPKFIDELWLGLRLAEMWYVSPWEFIWMTIISAANITAIFFGIFIGKVFARSARKRTSKEAI